MVDDGWQLYQGTPVFSRCCACSGEDDHAIGISRGGTTSKMHLMVNDVSDAPELIAAVDLGGTEAVSADKGYDSDKLRAQIMEEGSKANIPYKRDREEKNKDMDWYLYKIRHLVENAFARLKHYRAIATRYDKLKRNYLSTVLLGRIMVWLPL